MIPVSQKLDQLITKKINDYPTKRSFLVPMLLFIQDEIGHLTPDAISYAAQKTDLTELEVKNVISYYSLLHTRQMGKFHVQVCTNISCMLRGAEEVFDHCKQRLGIDHKEITRDGTFSLEEVECIGACSWAPAVQVNYDFYLEVTPDKMNKILDDYGKQTKQ